LCQAFLDRGIKASFIVGDKHLTTDRSGTIQSFKKGEYVGLTNCMVLTAGFDHPNVGCIVMASPTKSLTKYLQQVGRGTRLKNEIFVDRFAQQCIILDFIDSTTRHRLVNTWTLDKAKPPQDRTFTTKEKKFKLIEERERRHKQSVLEKDLRINLLKLPTPKIITSMRMQEPATQKQLEWIAKGGGYDIVNINYTKEMCAEIISKFLASDKQIWLLAREGYDVSQGVTVTEAKLAFKEIEIKKAKANAERMKKENKFPYEDIH
jgi:superfamily II DNA or RNA helicase